MNAHGLLVVFVVALMVSAGAGAAATGAEGTETTTTETATETEPESVDYDADASYDNGTVTFVVAESGSGVDGLDVSVDDESVGTTDANGTVTFDSNESEIGIEVSGENVTGEFEYALENGSLTLVEGGFEYAGEGDEARGPPTDMPPQANDRVSQIHGIINAFLDGNLDEDTTLGAALSDIVSQKKDASERGAPDDAGKPDDVGPSDDAEDGEESDDAENDEDDEDEDDEDDDSNGKSDDRGDRGNGNGNGRP